MYCIDSRLIEKGDIFVPVKGNNVDGHDFINDALSKGAKEILEEIELYTLAKKKLDKICPVIVGVGGSFGKTSFRSFLTQILKTKFSVLEGKQNTKLGLSLAILNCNYKYSVFVAEIGIDHLGEMEDTISIVKPTFSILTKLGKEHIEGLKSYENVINEELNIIKLSKQKFGYINVYDKDDLKDKINGLNYEFFPDSKIPKFIQEGIENINISKHNKDYLSCIYTIVKKHFDFSDEDFIKSLQNISIPEGRGNIIYKDNYIVINDTYNAVCDQTIIEGITYAKNISKEKDYKLVTVISNMVENGNTKEEQHKNVANFINTQDLETLYLVGPEADNYNKFLKTKRKTYEDAMQIPIEIENNTVYYIKATRRYLGDKLVEKLISNI